MLERKMSEIFFSNIQSSRNRSSTRVNKSGAKFDVGDIICKKIYPGRDTWEQVCEVLEVNRDHYKLRPIQSRTTERDWSTTSYISGATFLHRGGWEEDQTSLFSGITLEETQQREECEKKFKIRQMIQEEMQTIIRKIVREELVAAGVPCDSIE